MKGRRTVIHKALSVRCVAPVSMATARLIQDEQGLRWRSERGCLSMVFGGFRQIKVGPVTLGRYGRRATSVYSVMRYVNSQRAGRRVYIWSDRPSLIFERWHKMW
jgi:hypothetical protein